MRYSLAASSPTSPTLPSKGAARFTHQYLWVVIVASVVTVSLGFMLYCCVRRRYLATFMHQRAHKEMFQRATRNLRRFPLHQLEKATNNFSCDCLLGSGAFGNVYKGIFEEGTLAIKRAHPDSYQNINEFRNEVELLSRVKHRNLLGLVGFCEEAGQRILVYEYVPNGSLFEYIAGIAHLHEGIKPSIIHRDIKPSNILIADGFEAKVSDFGLVRWGPTGDASHVSSQIKGTPGYLDPAYCSSYHLTPFSDVYSFGVILLQLVAARPAVDTTRKHSQYHIIEWARPSIESGAIEDILDNNLLSQSSDMEMMLKVSQLGLKCVTKVPRQRPTMTQVWQELEEALHSIDHTSIHKNPSRGSQRSVNLDDSQRFVSVDRVGLQRFRVEMDSLSFQSTSLRCLENNSISIDMDRHSLGGISEESNSSEQTTTTKS
ncbi:probable serine/threonine-protein kinase PBL10 isoform X2 [Magnolia sinica]|uniref:probable serine/threonine-protein kinase PBL10 isoform X2 n=1 Tax=Magnolia sinica TaxID=86752 RepID=UPI00265AB391|nr:probable serine/threonine-protein kinase PBL10 isoform X2 [Magnolia sinica]